MRIEAIRFSEFVGQHREWTLNGSSFVQTNLIVGRNAAGKTRLLNVINGLAQLLASKRTQLYESASYEISFVDGKTTYSYFLDIAKSQIRKERLEINDRLMFQRSGEKPGKIFNAATNEMTPFQSPTDQLVISSRRDSLQHPYLEPLYDWGISVRHYKFGTPLDQEKMKTAVQLEVETDVSTANDPDAVLDVFLKGQRLFGEKFKKRILGDFRAVGYDCSKIGTMNIAKYLSVNQQIISLSVQEKNLKTPTPQHLMSQGMWRALAILIHVNYISFKQIPGCILIDDIGEGLDYGRSSKLVSILISRAKRNKIQLFLTTNDRFIMNGIELRHWSVLHRVGASVVVFNERNSEKAFKEFEHIGLTNFDFFSSEFFLGKEK